MSRQVEQSIDELPAASVLVERLRPVVHVSPLPDGLHVRGWDGGFVVTGGRGLIAVWRMIAPLLADGVVAGESPRISDNAGVQQAVKVLMAQLREHRMLVAVPRSWGASVDGPSAELAGWLESAAADPVGAWQRLARTTVTVEGAGPIADAAVSAVTRLGLTVSTGSGAHLELAAAQALVTAEGTAVIAAASDEVAFVTATGSPDATIREAELIARRLGIAMPGAAPPPVLMALAGGAAAHRVICQVAGFPDPAEQRDTDQPENLGLPAVLIARLDPLRVEYHPWPGAGGTVPSGPASLDTALKRLAILGDEELGVVSPAGVGDLPQLPAALAVTQPRSSGHPAPPILAGAVTADIARLTAACEAALQHARSAVGGLVAVGVDEVHARGLALRRLVSAKGLPASPVPDTEWQSVPVSRRWWKAITLGLGVESRLKLVRYGDGTASTGAFHATIGREGAEDLGWAIEPTAASAVAFAAVAAAAAVQAQTAGFAIPAGGLLVSGSAPAPEPPDGPHLEWVGDAWLWPSAPAGQETELQQWLGTLLRPGAVRCLATVDPTTAAWQVTASGFVLATWSPDGR